MAIKTEDINRAGLHGYLAQPAGGGDGGVLLLPTIFAVNQFARAFAIPIRACPCSRTSRNAASSRAR
jgi:hypothetical protein